MATAVAPRLDVKYHGIFKVHIYFYLEINSHIRSMFAYCGTRLGIEMCLEWIVAVS